MDWSSIGTQLILSIIAVVVPALSGFIGYYIKKYVNSKVSDSELAKDLTTLTDLVDTCVKMVQQTYVDELKDENMFDKEKQEEALKKCMDAIKSQMTNELKDNLSKTYVDLEAYIKLLVEAKIQDLKNKKSTEEKKEDETTN